MIFSLPSIAKAFFFRFICSLYFIRDFLLVVASLPFLILDSSILTCCPRILIHLTSATSFGIEK